MDIVWRNGLQTWKWGKCECEVVGRWTVYNTASNGGMSWKGTVVLDSCSNDYLFLILPKFTPLEVAKDFGAQQPRQDLSAPDPDVRAPDYCTRIVTLARFRRSQPWD